MNYIIINRFNMLINIDESLRPHQLSTKITSKISFKKAPVLKRKFWENIAENLHPVGREN